MLMLRNILTILALGLLVATELRAYEPDPAVRKSIAKEVKPELIARTPSNHRFSAGVGLAGNVPFKDYERLAKDNGYAPYDDCSIATFVEVTSYQVATAKQLEAKQVAALFRRCESSDVTVVGRKPLTQAIGDQEILRGMWQRMLEFTGGALNDEGVLAAARRDATERFEALYGNPAEWQPGASGFARIATPQEQVAESENTQTSNGQSPPSSTSGATTSLYPKNGVEQLILRTETGYGLSGVFVENTTYLLMHDGSIFSKPYGDPYLLNVISSKRTQPKSWGQWRKTGKTLHVTWPGKAPTTWETWFSCRNVGQGERLRGRFQSADSFGGDAVVNFNTIVFDRDGRFSMAVLKGGNTAWLPVYSDSRSAGRYTLGGYAIHLRFNNGSTKDYAFCAYPKDNEHFAIGANHFAPL